MAKAGQWSWPKWTEQGIDPAIEESLDMLDEIQAQAGREAMEYPTVERLQGVVVLARVSRHLVDRLRAEGLSQGKLHA